MWGVLCYRYMRIMPLCGNVMVNNYGLTFEVQGCRCWRVKSRAIAAKDSGFVGTGSKDLGLTVPTLQTLNPKTGLPGFGVFRLLGLDASRRWIFGLTGEYATLARIPNPFLVRLPCASQRQNMSCKDGRILR